MQTRLFYFRGRIMPFSFYTIDPIYCDFLRQYDCCIPHIKADKSNRPFIGIIFSINGFQYYAPLTSPKAKHLHMKNQIDFLKINKGIWGAINLNNMIPVPAECLTKVNMQISPADTKADIAYKNLLSNQLTWCNAHKSLILKQAEALYNTLTNGIAWDMLAKRCCNFKGAETLCLQYKH